jgi:hypothetical protein
MSLETQLNHLTAEIIELRSVVNALTLAMTGLTKQAAEELHAKRAPFIHVIKPDDPRYAEEMKAFHQDSIFEPRLETFEDWTPSTNTPQDQGAIIQKAEGLPRKSEKNLQNLGKLPPLSGKRRVDAGTKRVNYPATTYSSCCGAERRKKSKHDGKCVECR